VEETAALERWGAREVLEELNALSAQSPEPLQFVQAIGLELSIRQLTNRLRDRV
jgi:hypothetical protein